MAPSAPKATQTRPCRHQARLRRQRGQTLVEFALVSMLFVFMMVVTFNAVIAFSVHQYISYAVFMAARAYQASGDNLDSSATSAIETLKQFSLTGNGKELEFKLFGRPVATINSISVPRAQNFDYSKSGPSEDLFVGVNFEVPFVTLPLGENMRRDFASVKLEARSFLGREPSRDECLDYFKRFLNHFALDSSPVSGLNKSFNDKNFKFMDDNGC